MVKKRNLFLVLLVVMSLVVVGCGQDKASDKTSGSDESKAKVYTCKIGTDEPEGTPKHEAQMMFADRVAELTNNEVQVTIYPGNQLGSSRER